ncbi:metal ABC transporter solute-binding protein, Zn/Mn family [Helicobacter canis]|uniref:metal ABC transporter solute-binding protein, Zn/Mn family n=1 Tax=Helicobacter canis TaxID=29419 RepID=UPI0029427F71|nr:zinc ABC transporter substrate-binding protein [Helicobacter canis]
MMVIVRYCVLVLLVSLGSVGAESIGGKKPLVLVSVPPQLYFVRAIAGDSVEARSVVPADVSPETYEPKPSQARAFMQAAVFFGVGMSYERALQTRLASTNRALLYTDLAHIVLDHDRHDEHAHTKLDSTTHTHDPHIWLSLKLAKAQAKAMYESLCAISPAHKESYTKNLATFFAQVDKIGLDLARILAGQRGRAFLVLHPAFGYLAQEFGLEEIALEEDGKEIKLKALSRLPKLIEEKHIRTLFIQPQFDKERAESIAKTLGLNVEILDPLNENWEESLYAFAHKIKEQ